MSRYVPFHIARPPFMRYEKNMSLRIPPYFSRILAGLLFLAVLPFFQPAPACGMGAAPERYAVGMRTFGVWEPESQERLDFAVWYPSSVHGADNVLEGWVVEVGKRGRIEPGFFPLILLSHDTATGRFANNDLAASLAAGGMLVIVPTHTGDSQISGSAMYSAELMRDRPRHLLRALETVLASPDFAPHADESRIGLLGVGFGCITALQLAGVLPDFRALQGYCLDAPDGNAFCSAWVAERLALLPDAMRALEKSQGSGIFTPPLNFYAPRLMRVAVPAEDAESKAQPLAEARPSLWQRLFGSEKEDSPPPVVNATEAVEKGGDSAAKDAANFPLLLDFQGGPRFGGTDSGAPFVHIALSDSQQYRVPVPDGEAPATPEPQPEKADGPRVYLRPAENRRILGIALVAPSGGMLFSSESLSKVQRPVAVVEAGANALYPPMRHSQPYVSNFPMLPLTLSFDGVDHFSLFAQCSRNTRQTLAEMCGRLGLDERLEVAEKRDEFLVPFFQSVLGSPLPFARPSGLVAAPEHVGPDRP